MNEQFVDINYSDIADDEDYIYNAKQIADKVDLKDHNIREWGRELYDHLSIKKINGQMKYSKKCIEEFKFIKKLKQEQKMSLKVIAHIFENKKIETSAISIDTVIPPVEQLAYETLLRQMAENNEKTMASALEKMFEYIEKREEYIINKVRTETIESMTEVLELNNKEIVSRIDDLVSENINKKIGVQTNRITRELSNNTESIKSELRAVDNSLSINSKLLDTSTELLKTELKAEIKTSITEVQDVMVNEFRSRMDRKKEAAEAEKKLLQSMSFINKLKYGFKKSRE